MARQSEAENSLNRANPLTVVKKAYASPCLWEYGSIAKLTQSGNGTGADGGSMADMMMV
jgi:hypothetical protein